MKKKPLHRISSLLAATVLGLFLLTGCAGKSTEAVQAQEDADTIQVYLWSNYLYEKYAPYVQARLPDVCIGVLWYIKAKKERCLLKCKQPFNRRTMNFCISAM